MRPGWTAASPAWVSAQLGILNANAAVVLNQSAGRGGTGDFMIIMQEKCMGNTEKTDPLAILLGDINSVKQNSPACIFFMSSRVPSLVVNPVHSQHSDVSQQQPQPHPDYPDIRGPRAIRTPKLPNLPTAEETSFKNYHP